MRRPAGLVLGGALAVVLSACGLPLPGGVQTPRVLPEDRPRAEEVVVLPPGPAEGATARDVVEDFLRAQSSPEGDHAVARLFLTPEASQTWEDDDRVSVYDPLRPLVVRQTDDPEIVRVTAQQTAVVAADGTYARDARETVEDYRVRCAAQVCRIAALEPGLRLTPEDLVRSFSPRAVHFLGPAVPGDPDPRHLVPDRVWLPRTQEVQRLVQALLDGPSDALGDSVRTAVPGGTRLLSATASADGTVTVDLTGQVRALDEPGRERLSAQLVWTLRGLSTGFTRLRLRVEGAPLPVGGSTAAQAATDWAAYDPERLRSRSPALYVQDRRLRTLGEDPLSPSEATDGRLPVDVVAARPDGGLALLTDRADGDVEVRTGPQGGPFGPARVTGAVSSPSWGGGERGLFLVQDGSVRLLPPEGGSRPVPVETDGRAVRQVRVSRDGVRVALLVGDPERPDLLIGRLVDDGTGLRAVDLRAVAPTLGQTTDLAWETSQTLVVLTAFGQLGLLPARLPVDGFTVTPLSSRLPLVAPLSLAAAADRPVVLSGQSLEDPETPPRIYRESGGRFTRVPDGDGDEPAYPG